jgi:hypothetical protein
VEDRLCFLFPDLKSRDEQHSIYVRFYIQIHAQKLKKLQIDLFPKKTYLCGRILLFKGINNIMQLEITPDIRVGKQLYRQYYWRQFIKQLSSFFMLFSLLAAIIIIGLGLYLEQYAFLRYVGQFILAIYLFYLGMFSAQQIYYCRLRIKNVFGDKKSEAAYSFGYDETGLSYATDGQRNQISWDYFQYYQAYPQELYLFDKRKNLVDIISAKIIGAEAFTELKAMVEAEDLERI